ncbi:tail tape measure protein [Dickeya phage Amaethon]|nr:tail tape measure protein [Dickeya phage Amaethon]
MENKYLAQVRMDGPNQTATTSTFNFNTGPGNFSLDSEDSNIDGEPSRLVTNMAANVEEDELPNVSQYTRQAIGAEMRDAISGGKTQLVTPVADETQAFDYRQLARETGAVYSETQYNGQRHAVLRASDVPPVNLDNDSFKAADAISQGYQPAEVQKYLKEQGYEDVELNKIITQAGQINTARENGYDDDAIRNYINDTKTQVTEQTKSPKAVQDAPGWEASSLGNSNAPQDSWYDKLRNFTRGVDQTAVASILPKAEADAVIRSTEEVSAEELLTSLQVIAPSMVSMTTRTAGFFGNQEAALKAESAANASREKIVQLAAKRGLQLEWSDEAGTFVANTPSGVVPVDDSIWDSLLAQGGEITGGITGGIAGARMGGSAGASAGPWGALGGAAIGSVLGAAGGSALGAQYDYLYQAIKLQENLEGSVMANKAMTAAEASVVGDIIGFGVFKSGAAFVKTFKRVKDFVVDGNSAGAYKALKEYEFISDDQAANMVSALTRLQADGTAAVKNEAEAAIRAGALTQPGSEGLVQAAASFNPKVGAAVAKSIDTRAKDLLETTGAASGEDLGRILREDLGNFVSDVKMQFHNVKAQAAQSPRAANFRFDYDNLAINPVLSTLQKNIMDPTVLEKFMLQASKVRDMADGRTFSDLLDLRQLVNEFRFNKNITKAKDFSTLTTVIRDIDKEIERGANYVFDKPNNWLSEFAQARINYAKMKNIEENVMYKALNKEGANAEDITRNLTRYISAVDGTFTNLVKELPTHMRARVENAAVDNLANKYTVGAAEGIRATNFPALARELAAVQLTTPYARQLKAAIGEMAEVFKNDVPLSRITSNIQVPKFQSYLTTDAVARVKYEIASGIFNYAKTLLPGKAQSMLALVRKSSQLLENPLNAKTMREVMDLTAGKVDISPQVLKLQQEAARAAAAGKDTSMPRVRLYGKGSTLSVKAASEGQQADRTIPVHRIATAQDVSRIAAQSGINVADTKVLEDVLLSQGYKAIQQGTDRVRLLKDQ